MGVDTKGYTRKNVEWVDIYQYIKASIDENATHDFRDVDGLKPNGHIMFNYNEEKRQMFFCTTKDIIEGTEFDGTEEHGNLILGYWGSSVEIMQKIVSQFGGYVDDSDCDTEEAYYIPKTGGDEFESLYKKRKQIESVLTGSQSFKASCAMSILENYDIIKTIIEDK